MLRACCHSLLLVVAAAILFSPQRVRAGAKDERLDIYFIDVEGGAATLIVTPVGESILIDSGYPDNHGRDLNRILHVVRDVAGLKQIDHAAVSHWHLDHYGNHAALAAEIRIGDFYDRGIPDAPGLPRSFFRLALAEDGGSRDAAPWASRFSLWW